MQERQTVHLLLSTNQCPKVAELAERGYIQEAAIMPH